VLLRAYRRGHEHDRQENRCVPHRRYRASRIRGFGYGDGVGG
jgi:hypothetical protein